MEATAPRAGLVKPLASGDVLWERVRLEVPLGFRPNQQVWRVIDLKTSSVHALWLLANDRAPDVIDPAGFPRELMNGVAAVLPLILPIYRIEGTRPFMGMITAFHPLLANPPWLAADQVKTLGHAVALEWLNLLGAAVAGLHESGLRAHGSISPEFILTDGTQPPVLTGYPYARFEHFSPADGFLSPQRRSGNDPLESDDVFSMGALGYFLLSGGSVPSPSETNSEIPSVDAARERQSLSALGWKEGWDHSLLRALRATPSLRPGSIRLLIDSINEGAGRTLLPASPSGQILPPVPRPETRRKVPPWRASFSSTRARSADARRVNPDHRAGEVSEGNQSHEDLRLQLEKERIAISELQAQLKAERIVLNQRRAAMDLEEKVRREEISARAVGPHTVSPAKGDAVKADAARAELVAREKQLGAILGNFAEIAGGSTLAHLQTLARQLEQRKIEQDRLAARLKAERSKLESMRHQREEPKSGPSDVQSSSSSKPEVIESAPVGHTTEPPPTESTAPSFVPSTENSLRSERSGSSKTTLDLGNGRKLHLISGTVLRFGRQADSDILLLSRLAPLYRELSRKHFEIRLDATAVQLIDGWSDDGKSSRQGVCVDGRRVSKSVELRTGGLISVTTRAPGPTVPRWRVAVIRPAQDSAIPALFLQRQDELPDDILLLNGRVALSELGFAEVASANLSITCDAHGFAWIRDDEVMPMTEDRSPLNTLTVLSVGRLIPTLPPNIAGT